MKITYTLGPEDLIAFNLFHIGEDPRAQRMYKIQTSVFAFLMVALTFYGIKKGVPKNRAYPFFFGALVLWFIGFRYLFKKIIERRMRKLLAKNPGGEHFGEKSMEFEDKYLMETTGGKKRKLYYDKIHRSLETTDYIYIYEEPAIAYTLPKRDLTDEQVVWIKEKLGMKDLRITK